MKKLCLLLSLCLLAGCAAEPVYETIGNVWDNPQIQEIPASIEFKVPDDAQMEVMESLEKSQCYRIGDWMLWTEVLQGGDIQQTVETMTGMHDLPLISYPLRDQLCYETAWSVQEEEGTFVIRTAVIPKGQYHYCLNIKVPQEDARQMGSFFADILDSVYLNDSRT